MREKMTSQISFNLLLLKDEYVDKTRYYENVLEVYVRMMSD